MDRFYVYDGRPQSTCKKCRNDASSKWNQENRDQINARRREKAQNDGWAPQTKWTKEERKELFRKNSERNRKLLKKNLQVESCTACGNTSFKLTARHRGTPVSAMVERSKESFDLLLREAEYLCKTCWTRERREKWSREYNPDELRECNTCAEKKPLKEFHQVANPKHIKKCRVCFKQHAKEKADQRRAKCKLHVDNLKRKPCTDCGCCFDPIAMDFDHLPEFEKKAEVSRLVSQGNMKALKEELSKCELVCSNCHRVRTQQRTSLTI